MWTNFLSAAVPLSPVANTPACGTGPVCFQGNQVKKVRLQYVLGGDVDGCIIGSDPAFIANILCALDHEDAFPWSQAISLITVVMRVSMCPCSMCP